MVLLIATSLQNCSKEEVLSLYLSGLASLCESQTLMCSVSGPKNAEVSRIPQCGSRQSQFRGFSYRSLPQSSADDAHGRSTDMMMADIAPQRTALLLINKRRLETHQTYEAHYQKVFSIRTSASIRILARICAFAEPPTRQTGEEICMDQSALPDDSERASRTTRTMPWAGWQHNSRASRRSCGS